MIGSTRSSVKARDRVLHHALFFAQQRADIVQIGGIQG